MKRIENDDQYRHALVLIEHLKIHRNNVGAAINELNDDLYDYERDQRDQGRELVA